MADALARGGPLPDGSCVEVGCGTGLLTPLLAQVWSRVVCLDLSWDMLHRSRAPARVLADASRLPLLDGQAAAVVLADVPLFAPDVVRVLAGDGVVVWSNALGTGAPHHVPVETVRSALDRASGARPGRRSRRRPAGACGRYCAAAEQPQPVVYCMQCAAFRHHR